MQQPLAEKSGGDDRLKEKRHLAASRVDPVVDHRRVQMPFVSVTTHISAPSVLASAVKCRPAQ